MAIVSGVNFAPPGSEELPEGVVDVRDVRAVVDEALDIKFPDTGRRQTYKDAMPDAFNDARYHMKDAYDLPRVSELNGRTNWAAEQYKGQYGVWPGADQLIAYPKYINAVELYVSGAAAQPGVFGFRDENGGTQWIHNTGYTWTAPSVGSLLAGTGAVGSRLQNKNLMVYPSYEAVWESLSPVSTGGTGSSGRGAGGGGRGDLVFDRDRLASQASDRWRGLLLEDPDEATLEQLITDFITKANAFWMNEAGQLDFDTFIVDRIETTERFKFLYEKKPEFQTPAEYMAGFRNAVGSFGMNDRATLREVEAGAHSGAGLAGFSERVGRTREARVGNLGTFSQQMANSMSSSGLGRT